MTADPASDTRLTADELDNVLEVFADFVDVSRPAPSALAWGR